MPQQYLPTVDATSWKHFEIDGSHYLAVANYYDGRTFNLKSKIYKFGPGGFSEHQEIATSGAYHWEHFTIGSRHFLAVANYYNDKSFDIDSKIYAWNGQSFEEFQSIATNGAFDVHYFRIGPEHWLGIANEVSNSPDGKLRYAQNSKLYRWDGQQFRYFQAIPTAGAHALKAFKIDSQHYLAVAQYYEDSGTGAAAYRPPARILRWHSTKRGFVDFQTLPAAGGYDVEYFTVDGGHYLAVANSYNGETFDIPSRIFKWNGTKFEQHQNLATHNAVDIHTFRAGGDFFLAVSNATTGNKSRSNFHVNSHIYRWSAGRLVLFESIPTKGAYAMESFSIGGQTFLAVANSFDGKSTNLDSVIYMLNQDRPSGEAHERRPSGRR